MSQRIAPPFPFPHLWDDVRRCQIINGSRLWSVPSYPLSSVMSLMGNESNAPVAESEDDVMMELKVPSSEYIISEVVGDEDDEEVVLCMNDVWVERLSKSLKRKQKKAYKSQSKTK